MPLSLAAGDQIGESESAEPRMELRKSSESAPGRTCCDREHRWELGDLCFALHYCVSLGKPLTLSGPHMSFLQCGKS